MYLGDQGSTQSAATENVSVESASHPHSDPVGPGQPSQQSDLASQREIPSRPRANKLCRFFLRGNCRDGHNCRYKHVTRDPNVCDDHEPDERLVEEEDNGSNDVDEASPKTGRTKPGRRFGNLSDNPRHCQFFLRGFCRNGRDCRFIHPFGLRNKLRRDAKNRDRDERNRVNDSAPDPIDVEQYSAPEPVEMASTAVLPNSRQEYQLDQLTPGVASELREIEIQQIKKRYPRGDYDDGCSMTFLPTDPDWPYDVKQLDMVVVVPDRYPIEVMTFSVSQDQNLPPTLHHHIEHEVNSWLVRRHSALVADGKAQLMFRPLLIWLDRQLERLFTEGLTELKKELVAKAAGLEFLPAWKLRKRDNSETSTGNETSSGNETESEEDSCEEVLKLEEVKLDDAKGQQTKSESLEPERKGTEIKLRHLQLQEHAGTLLADKLRITIQCSRCKTDQDINLRARRLSSVTCNKCHYVILVNYRPAIMHQFADIMGFLDLEGCAALDLILSDCEFTIGCSNCSREMKKERMSPGAVQDVRCHTCHGKLRICAESARFFQLAPGGALDVKKAQPLSGGRKKTKKDVLIHEGQPLPDEGTCKHYKKSFRWFRFPCCGKIYPCDHCHEERKADGHEMIWANRMICGHCSHEQPYSPDKPCRLCQHSLTKSSGGAFWEGGKGCRDKIRMSKNDVHKYQNVSKTISKSTQKKSDQQKRTKPRHT